MRPYKIRLLNGEIETVQGQVFTHHFPQYSGGTPQPHRFFYYWHGATVVVCELVSGGRFNTFYPFSNQLIKDAKESIEQRLRQYGCEKVHAIIKAARRSPLNW